jgi:hypothetical protein
MVRKRVPSVTLKVRRSDMDVGVFLALTKNWWVRYQAVDPVKTAIRKVLRKHWKTTIDELLRRNKTAGKRPGTWKELAEAIGLNFVKLWRRLRGTACSPEDLHGLSQVLGIPINKLFPDGAPLVSGVAYFLCAESVAENEPSEEYNVYANYCTKRTLSPDSYPRHDDPLKYIDHAAVEWARRKTEHTYQSCQETICATARKLAPALLDAAGRNP